MWPRTPLHLAPPQAHEVQLWRRWTCWNTGSELSDLNAESLTETVSRTLASTAGYHPKACPLEPDF